MGHLDVTDALVRSLALEVAPLVEELTGWPLQAESLRCRVVSKDRGYEELVLGRLRGAGIPIDEDAHRSLVERLVEYVVEGNLLAAYQPGTQELLVVRENVDESNLDGLRLIVAHELVHRGQHLNHGELFERVDDAVRHVFGELCAGSAGLRELWDGAGHVQAIMTLLESHAYYVQEQLRRTRFAGAAVERHFGLAPLLLRALGGFKLSQYTLAVPQVAEATRTGTIEELYASLSESGGGHAPFAL